MALEHTNSALKAELAGAPVDSPVWAHELTLPEKGCLLLAREKGVGQFTNAVVLLCQHGTQRIVLADHNTKMHPLHTDISRSKPHTCVVFVTDSLGSNGFIINMPLPRHLQDLSTKVALAGMSLPVAHATALILSACYTHRSVCRLCLQRSCKTSKYTMGDPAAEAQPTYYIVAWKLREQHR